MTLPPGPRAPRVIQTIGWWTRPTAFLDRCRRRYGPRFTVRLLGQPPFVTLTDPDEIRRLFTAAPDILHPGEGAVLLAAVLGENSVIVLDEAPHMEQRRLLLPAFHGERIQRLAGLMTELTEQAVAGWPAGRPVVLHDRLQQLTLDIILRAVFGLDEGARLDALRPPLRAMLEFGESPLSLLPLFQGVPVVRRRYVRFQRHRAAADRLLFDLIAERRADPGERDDILAMLLAATHGDGSPMSDQEIRDELLTALVAGHETTASSLAFAFELIGRAPRAVQDRIAGGDDAYLDATITEVLRCRPVLPNPEPRLVKQPVEIGGWTYPVGTVLLAGAHLVHHDPAIYEHPRAFRPERFLGVKPGTYTWLPFGGGRRRCLGASFALLEMRVVLQAALGRFAVEAGGPERGVRRRMITITPKAGGRVVLRPRERRPRECTDAATAVAA